MPHVPRRAHFVCVCFVFLSSWSWPVSRAPAQEPTQRRPAPILSLDDIRVGMKGYGLTVFQGTRIEPFVVEVVAVMRNFAPGRGVIWGRCTDQRMQKLGPVQGMSGSPIYLWSDADPAPHKPGQGGRLIGALALGFSGTKDCYVGIQPIEQMRQVAARAVSGAPHPQSSTLQGISLHRQLENLLDVEPKTGPRRWRARAVLRLLDRLHPYRESTFASQTTGMGIPQPVGLAGQVHRLNVPMTIGSAQLAQVIAPAVAPLGITPVCLTGMGGERRASGHASPVTAPPPGIDVQSIRLEPGSVLSVPLAFGDIDLSAIGTVTEVQPDGRILAFGHGIFSQGVIAAPMATGYIHFIMPSLSSSFKLGGSAVIQGAIVRDEHSAVVGVPSGRFIAAPVRVAIHRDGDQPASTYKYQIAHHKQLTPFITAAVVLQSITAQSNLPIEHTLRLNGKIQFSGDHTLELNSTLINMSATDLVLEIMPVIATMMQNPHESMTLESFDVTVDIEPAILSGSIVNAHIDRAEVAPGDTLTVTAEVQPYGASPIKQRINLNIPKSLADGDYDLILCDAKTYIQLLLDSRPHLLATSSVGDLHRVLQRILSVSGDALYAVLQLPESGLAVGRQELPQLPSSRRVMFDTPTSTVAAPYMDWIEKVVPMGLVIEGNTKFTIGIRQALVEPQTMRR